VYWTLDVYSYAMFHSEPCLKVEISSAVCVCIVEATRRTSPSTLLPLGHHCLISSYDQKYFHMMENTARRQHNTINDVGSVSNTNSLDMEVYQTPTL